MIWSRRTLTIKIVAKASLVSPSPDWISIRKNEEKRNLGKYWPGAFELNDDTRRHHAMLEQGLRFLKSVGLKSALSIGDTYGRDAAFIKKYLGCNVTASDLESNHLYPAVEAGLIDEIRDIDAESIQLTDDTFDLIVCKESMHHFAQPMRGLYEMLRVARKSVLIIEPNDVQYEPATAFHSEKGFHDGYEQVGNYVYQISVRECCKCAWSLNIPGIITSGFNDPWAPDIEFLKWQELKKGLDNKALSDERQFNLMAVLFCIDPDVFDKAAIFARTDPMAQIYTRPFNPWLLGES